MPAERAAEDAQESLNDSLPAPGIRKPGATGDAAMAIAQFKDALARARGRQYAENTTVTYANGWYFVRHTDGARSKYRKRMLLFWASRLLEEPDETPFKEKLVQAPNPTRSVLKGTVGDLSSESSALSTNSSMRVQMTRGDLPPGSSAHSMVRDKRQTKRSILLAIFTVGFIEFLALGLYASGNTAPPGGQSGGFASETGLFLACYSLSGCVFCGGILGWLLFGGITNSTVKIAWTSLATFAGVGMLIPIGVIWCSPPMARLGGSQHVSTHQTEARQEPPRTTIPTRSTTPSDPSPILPNPNTSSPPTKTAFSGWSQFSTGHDWNAATEADKRYLCGKFAAASVKRLSSDFYYDGLEAMFDTSSESILKIKLYEAAALLALAAR